MVLSYKLWETYFLTCCNDNASYKHTKRHFSRNSLGWMGIEAKAGNKDSILEVKLVSGDEGES
jgi:hypothetical protein